MLQALIPFSKWWGRSSSSWRRRNGWIITRPMPSRNWRSWRSWRRHVLNCEERCRLLRNWRRGWGNWKSSPRREYPAIPSTFPTTRRRTRARPSRVRSCLDTFSRKSPSQQQRPSVPLLEVHSRRLSPPQWLWPRWFRPRSRKSQMSRTCKRCTVRGCSLIRSLWGVARVRFPK